MSHGVAQLMQFGQEKTDQVTDSAHKPIGALAQQADGSLFSWALSSAAAAVAQIMMGKDVPADQENDMVLGAAAAVGANSIEVTAGATTAIVKNEFSGGYLIVNDDGASATEQGQSWKIRSNDVAATTVDATFTFMPNDSVRVALATATSQLALVHNPLYNFETWDADDVDGVVPGVTPAAFDAADYGWLRNTGVSAGLTDGVIVKGNEAQASNNLDGSVEHWDNDNTATAIDFPVVGSVLAVAADTEYSIIRWKIPTS